MIFNKYSPQKISMFSLVLLLLFVFLQIIGNSLGIEVAYKLQFAVMYIAAVLIFGFSSKLDILLAFLFMLFLPIFLYFDNPDFADQLATVSYLLLIIGTCRILALDLYNYHKEFVDSKLKIIKNIFK